MADSTENHALRQDLDKLREDFSSLSDDVKTTYHDEMRAGRRKARQWGQELCDEVESRPYTSMLAAFGVGLLLGKVISR